MKDKSILIEINALNDGRSGVEKTLIKLRDMIVSMGYSVDVVVLSKNRRVDSTFEYSFDTIVYDDVDFNKYSLIIVSLEGTTYNDFIKKVGNVDARIIKIIHGDPELLVERYDFDFIEMYRSYNLADRIVVLNDAFKAALPNDLQNKTVTIPHSFEFKKVQKSLDSKLISYVGRFDEPNKQVIKLLGVWNEVIKVQPNAVFEIYGQGLSKAHYNKIIKKNKLKGVTLHDWVVDVDEVFSRSKINVLLSKHEGLPLSLVESIDVGTLTVVSKDSLWTQNLVHDALKVDVNDSKGLVDFIVKLLDLSLADYNNLALTQKRKVEDFLSLERVGKGWSTLIEGVLLKNASMINSRTLNDYNKHSSKTLHEINESKLKKEYDTLAAKYQYVLSILAKKK